MSDRPWLPPLAFGIASAMVGAATTSVALLQTTFLSLAGISFAVAAIAAARQRRSDPYDLDELRRVHERDVVDSIEVEEPTEYDSVHCLYCGTDFSVRLPVCPECRRSP